MFFLKKNLTLTHTHPPPPHTHTPTHPSSEVNLRPQHKPNIRKVTHSYKHERESTCTHALPPSFARQPTFQKFRQDTCPEEERAPQVGKGGHCSAAEMQGVLFLFQRWLCRHLELMAEGWLPRVSIHLIPTTTLRQELLRPPEHRGTGKWAEGEVGKWAEAVGRWGLRAGLEQEEGDRQAQRLSNDRKNCEGKSGKKRGNQPRRPGQPLWGCQFWLSEMASLLRCSKEKSDVTESCSQRHWEALCSSWALGARDSGLRLQTQESPLPTALPRAADNPGSWALAPAPEAASPGTVRVWEGQQHREKESCCWNAFSHPLPQRARRTPARICPESALLRQQTHTKCRWANFWLLFEQGLQLPALHTFVFLRILQGVRGALRFT